MTRNDRRLDSLRRLAAEYRTECVIELIWQACLTYDVEAHRVRRLAEEELGLPYLRIETDYSPSDSADCRAGGGSFRDHSRRARASRRNLESRGDGHGRLLQPVYDELDRGPCSREAKGF